MRITAIDIIGYGKWIDAHFHDLQAMQLFYGANEAGKSTIMAFIHSILFGFPTKQQSTPRMEPKIGGAYGGRLTLADTSAGTVTIERLKGKATGDVTLYLADGTIEGEEKWNELLGEMDRATYEAIFSFDLHALQHIHQWKQADFERYLLATSMTGSDLLLKTIQKLQKELDKRFKPSGRNPLINKQLEKVKAASQRFEEAKAQNANYEALYQEKARLSAEKDDNLAEQRALRVAAEQKRDWLEQWENYQEWKNIAAFLKDKDETPFPPDGIIRLEHLNTRLTENKNKQIQLHERKKQLEQQEGQTDHSFYANQQDKIAAVIETYPLFQENQQRFKQSEQEAAAIAAVIKQQPFVFSKEQLSANWQPKFLTQVEEIEAERQTQQRQIEQLQFFIEQEEAKQQQMQQQVDKLESEMWSPQKLQNWEASRTRQAPVAKKSFLLLPLGVIAIFGILVFLFPSKWTALLFGLTTIGAVLWLYWQKPAATKVEDNSEWAEQLSKRQAWQQLLTELDASQANTEAWREQKEQHHTDQKRLDQQITDFLNQLSITLENKPAAYYPFFVKLENLIQQLSKQDALLAQQEKLQVQTAKWQQQAEALQAPIEAATWDELIMLLKQGIRHYQNSIASATKLADKLEQADAELELLQRDATSLQSEKQTLLKQANATTEEAFRSRHRETEEIERNQARKHFLEMQSEPEIRKELQRYSTKEALKAELLETEEQLNQIARKQEKNHADFAKVAHQIELLEAGGTFSTLMQDFYTEKSELENQVREWMTIKLSLESLQRTLKKLQADKLPQALNLASSYFAKLTKNHYKRVKFTEQRLQVETNEQTSFFPEELSQATKEQLYLAVRFAFIDILHSKYPLPIIIDDSFVNFDKARLAEMMDLLKMRQGKNQVLMFSCHETSLDYFSSIERVVLY